MTDSSFRNHDFPVGPTLVSALIDLHRETEEKKVLDLIESEIFTEALGLVAVAVPDETPAPDASVETLIDLHERRNRFGKDVNRYIRLRIFDALGAFEDSQADGITEQDDSFAVLPDDDIRYLASLDDAEIQSLLKSEVSDEDRPAVLSKME